VNALRWYAALAGCLSALSCASPSPEKLRETLVRQPDILLDAIRAHPSEFVVLLDSVARATQVARQASLIADQERKIENGFTNPYHPSLEHRIAFGDERAPVTIVEYTDFECPYCRQVRPTLVEVMRHYDRQVRLVVKHFPMDFHPHAMPAALMFEAIARQNPDKALRFYDAMYEQQDRLATQGEPFVDQAAVAVGADLGRARQDARSSVVRGTVDADKAEAIRFGFTGTPGFVINGVPLEGVQSLESFERVIDRLLGKPAGR
jgi:protein-disulfide isomerase